MERKKLAVSISVGMAVAVCLLAVEPARGVIAISSTETISIRAFADASTPMFMWWADGPSLGSCQGSLEDSAVDPNGVSVSATASLDFDITVDAAAGTIGGTFYADTWASVGPHTTKYPLLYADSDMMLVFTVPQGEEGVYSLRGLNQNTSGSPRVRVADWNPSTGLPGSTTFALVDQAGAFDLGGALPPGTYTLKAEAHAGEMWWLPTFPKAANLSLQFSIVPEPGSVFLVLVSLLGGSVIHKKR